jgi:hypothetical protein
MCRKHRADIADSQRKRLEPDPEGCRGPVERRTEERAHLVLEPRHVAVVRPEYPSNMAAAILHQAHPAIAQGAGNELSAAMSAGQGLPRLVSPVALGRGEVLHARGDAMAWRFEAVDVLYEQHCGFALGGPVVYGLFAGAKAVANQRARTAAEREAAPQWRQLGHLPILATSHRLLVFHEGAWASVWYAGISGMRSAPVEGLLELTFHDDPPYALRGPWVPYLAVVVASALATPVPPALRSA